MPERMPGKTTNGMKKPRRRTRSGSERRRRGVIFAIAAGTGLGAFIGLVTGYLLTPRAKEAQEREPAQTLSQWQEIVRTLSKQLEAGESG